MKIDKKARRQAIEEVVSSGSSERPERCRAAEHTSVVPLPGGPAGQRILAVPSPGGPAA